MKLSREDIRVAEKLFDNVILKDDIRINGPAKVYDHDGRLIDFGFVIRVYFDAEVSMFRVGIMSVLTAREAYYDHTDVSGVA